MKGVNVIETRLFDQALAKNDLGYLTLKEHAIIDKAIDLMKASELYNKVGGDIENKANELVKEKCEPEWTRLSEAMQPLGEERNKLAKEKAEAKEGEWTDEKETKLADLDKQLADLSNEYQEVTNKANAELREYKDKRIAEEQGACFFLEDDEYEMIGKKVGWNLAANK